MFPKFSLMNILVLAAAALALLGPAPAHASLRGDSVNGALAIDGAPAAWGTGNTATVGDGVEFQLNRAQDEFVADFQGPDGTLLVLTWTRTGSFGSVDSIAWTFSGLDWVNQPDGEIAQLVDLGAPYGTPLDLQSYQVVDGHTIEIVTGPDLPPAVQSRVFQIVTNHEPARRSGWVPNVGQLALGERPLGDLWTFKCAKGMTVSISVDTKDDRDDGTSCLDPSVQLVDPDGMLIATGDDEMPCTYEQVCGMSCPSISNAPCGKGLHSIIVRDAGTIVTMDSSLQQCAKGGGYELVVEVKDASGHVVPEAMLNLGGGPSRALPKWATDRKQPGPALDDENVPRFGETVKYDFGMPF